MYRSPTIQKVSDLDFDLPRSLRLNVLMALDAQYATSFTSKTTGTAEKPTRPQILLFDIQSNISPAISRDHILVKG